MAFRGRRSAASLPWYRVPLMLWAIENVTGRLASYAPPRAPVHPRNRNRWESSTSTITKGAFGRNQGGLAQGRVAQGRVAYRYPKEQECQSPRGSRPRLMKNASHEALIRRMCVPVRQNAKSRRAVLLRRSARRPIEAGL